MESAWLDPPKDAHQKVRHKEQATRERAERAAPDNDASESGGSDIYHDIMSAREARQMVERAQERIEQRVTHMVRTNPALVRDPRLRAQLAPELVKSMEAVVEAARKKTWVDRLATWVDRASVAGRSIQAFFECVFCSFVTMSMAHDATKSTLSWWAAFVASVAYRLATAFPDVVRAWATSSLVQGAMNTLAGQGTVLRLIVQAVQRVFSLGEPGVYISACVRVLDSYFTAGSTRTYQVAMWFVGPALHKVLGGMEETTLDILRLAQAAGAGLFRSNPVLASSMALAVLVKFLCMQRSSDKTHTGCKLLSHLLKIPGVVYGLTSAAGLIAQADWSASDWSVMDALCKLPTTLSYLYRSSVTTHLHAWPAQRKAALLAVR